MKKHIYYAYRYDWVLRWDPHTSRLAQMRVGSMSPPQELDRRPPALAVEPRYPLGYKFYHDGQFKVVKGIWWCGYFRYEVTHTDYSLNENVLCDYPGVCS